MTTLPSRPAPRTPSKYWTLLAVLCSSAASILFRLSAAPALAAAFWRMALAALLLLVPALRRLRAERAALRPRTLLLCACSGAALALHFGAWITSLELTSVAASTVLVSMSPLFVAVFSLLIWRRRPSRALLLCLPAALLGTAVTVWGGSAGTLRGDALALLGAAAVAGYLLLGERVRRELSALVYACLVYAAAALFLMAACLVQGTPLGGYTGGQFLCFALMAAVSTIGGHTLNNYLLAFWSPQLLSLASLLEPVFSGLLALAVLREAPGLPTVFGGAVLLVSVGIYLKKAR